MEQDAFCTLRIRFNIIPIENDEIRIHHDVKYIWNYSYLNCRCRWKWRMIIAVNFQFKQLERRSLKKSGLQRDSNPWPRRYRCDALPTELCSHAFSLFLSDYLNWKFAAMIILHFLLRIHYVMSAESRTKIVDWHSKTPKRLQQKFEPLVATNTERSHWMAYFFKRYNCL